MQLFFSSSLFIVLPVMSFNTTTEHVLETKPNQIYFTFSHRTHGRTIDRTSNLFHYFPAIFRTKTEMSFPLVLKSREQFTINLQRERKREKNTKTTQNNLRIDRISSVIRYISASRFANIEHACIWSEYYDVRYFFSFSVIVC